MQGLAILHEQLATQTRSIDLLWPKPSGTQASQLIVSCWSTHGGLAGTYLDSGVGNTSLVWDSLSTADALRLAIQATLPTALSVENASSFHRCVISRISFST